MIGRGKASHRILLADAIGKWESEKLISWSMPVEGFWNKDTHRWTFVVEFQESGVHVGGPVVQLRRRDGANAWDVRNAGC